MRSKTILSLSSSEQGSMCGLWQQPVAVPSNSSRRMGRQSTVTPTLSHKTQQFLRCAATCSSTQHHRAHRWPAHHCSALPVNYSEIYTEFSVYNIHCVQYIHTLWLCVKGAIYTVVCNVECVHRRCLLYTPTGSCLLYTVTWRRLVQVQCTMHTPSHWNVYNVHSLPLGALENWFPLQGVCTVCTVYIHSLPLSPHNAVSLDCVFVHWLPTRRIVYSVQSLASTVGA